MISLLHTLFILTCINNVNFINEPDVSVSGYIYIMQNVISFKEDSQLMRSPFKNQSIVVVKGSVTAIPGKRYIPIKRIPIKSIVMTSSNDNGYFNVVLTKGKYTFFILQDGNLYNNNFSGSGFFSSHEIRQPINNFSFEYYNDI